MFSALCRALPDLHGARWWGLHTLRGVRVGDGTIELPRRTRLGVRVETQKLHAVMTLAGRTIMVGGFELTLGAPSVSVLAAAPALSARIVTIKGYVEQAPFEAAVQEQLDQFGIQASTQLGRRRVVRIAGRNIVGYSLRLADLQPIASVQIQEQGLGGRRRFGCGLFRPSRAPLQAEEG